MAIFTIWFQNFPNNLVILALATALAGGFVYIFLRSAMASDGRSTWVRRITSPNARVLFTVLFIGWAVVFGIGLQFVPHEGANSPYGGLGLIALFTGFFIMMGFLWAVIGE